ncbi:MAG TPA: YbdK family carboxylate-amine ligase [Gemmataceae bacterium]|jgi:carboxylate-amine ligase|nr:YbdK family carboxylate-amine ligase [Gemmataceae bacterium]
MTTTATLQPPTPKSTRAARGDELSFQSSLSTSLGVELELMILDHESGDLAPGAVPILKACESDSVAGVTAELMQSMIEVKTGVCQNVAEVRAQLLPNLRRLSNISRSLGYDLAFSATHPFHRTSGSVVYPAERYEQIVERLAWLTHQRVVFGLHVHVGVPSGDLAIATINMLVQYLPHLLALSANSPFWNGVDTGLASTRACLYRLLPHAGVPRYFPHWKQFRSFCQTMIDCKTIRSFKDIYWDIRPRPDFGTIEFRICDMPASLTEVFALTALTRCLVIHCLRLLEDRPKTRAGDIRKHWIAVENKWLATRYGLNGMYIRTPSGKRRRLRQDVSDLVRRLEPIARETGDAPFLTALGAVEKFESGADWQRARFREVGDWKVLMGEMKSRLATELAGNGS